MTMWSYIFQVSPGSRSGISAHIDVALSLEDALDEANIALEDVSSDIIGVWVADGFTRDNLVRILCHACGAVIDRTDNNYRDLGYDDDTDGMLAWMGGDDGCDCDAEDDDA